MPSDTDIYPSLFLYAGKGLLREIFCEQIWVKHLNPFSSFIWFKVVTSLNRKTAKINGQHFKLWITKQDQMSHLNYYIRTSLHRRVVGITQTRTLLNTFKSMIHNWKFKVHLNWHLKKKPYICFLLSIFDSAQQILWNRWESCKLLTCDMNFRVL